MQDILNSFGPSALYYLILVVGIVYSIVLHEIGHGFAALLFGDKTAKDAGRLTLNPIPHIDILGSIVLPVLAVVLSTGFLFGWAKPVPVDPRNFSNRRAGEIVVSLAGVTINFFIAILMIVLYVYTQRPEFIQIARLNVGLLYLNLLPLPPLDGYHFLVNVLPERYSRKISYYVDGREMVFLMILFLLFMSPIGRSIFIPAQYLFQGIVSLTLAILQVGV